MGTLLWVVFGLIAVSALIYYAAAVVFGPGEEIIAADPDRAPVAVPDDRVLAVRDIEDVRFPMAVRGYRMDEVDKFLDRIADELAVRDAISARPTFTRTDEVDDKSWAAGEPTVASDAVGGVADEQLSDGGLSAGEAPAAGKVAETDGVLMDDEVPTGDDVHQAGEDRR